jgi:hypothetical protein
LAGEEGADEVGFGVGDQADAVAGLGAGRQQARREVQGLVAQLGVGQGLDQLAAQRIEVDPGLTGRGEVERGRQGRGNRRISRFARRTSE